MEIAIVVAADEKNGIGYHNKLLCHLPNDLKYFKTLTTGHGILMGRNTFDSIGRPLPNRTNLVLSRQIAFLEGAEVFADIPSAIQYADDIGLTHLFVVGGDSIYKQALSFCSKVYLTRIHHAFEADAHFVALDSNEWNQVSAQRNEPDEKNAFAYTFEVFERK